MNATFYHKLTENFGIIKNSCKAEGLGTARVLVAVSELRSAKALLEQEAPKKECELLSYCIDTMIDIINEGNDTKAFDFASTVRDVPHIFLEERDIYSFSAQIDEFKSKYGSGYFPDWQKVYPKFNKRAPKNAVSFFSRDADIDFEEKHPIGYKVLVFAGITVLMLPQVLYLILVLSNDVESAWIFLGYVGSFIIGIGLFNIVAAFIHQYLGHLVTVGCIVGGGCLIEISLLLMYNKRLYNAFDQQLVWFFFVSIAFLLYNTILYVIFRFDMDDWMRNVRGIRKKKFECSSLVSTNFWWYQEQHNEHGLGIVYHLNKAYTVFTLASVFLSAVAIFLKPVAIVACGCTMASCLLAGILQLTVRLQLSIAYEKNKKNIFYAVTAFLSSVVIAYCMLMVTTSLWGIELPHL